MLDLYSMSADPSPRTILRIKEVLHRTGLKRTMFYDLIKKRKFPERVLLGARAVGYYEDEVEEWIGDLNLANREPEPPDQVAAHGTGKVPAPKSTAEGAQKARVVNPGRTKRIANSISAPAMMPTSVGSLTPRLTSNSEGDILEAKSESEELKLLREENTLLKRLVGELVLKNSVLQSSTGVKASSL